MSKNRRRPILSEYHRRWQRPWTQPVTVSMGQPLSRDTREDDLAFAQAICIAGPAGLALWAIIVQLARWFF